MHICIYTHMNVYANIYVCKHTHIYEGHEHIYNYNPEYTQAIFIHIYNAYMCVNMHEYTESSHSVSVCNTHSGLTSFIYIFIHARIYVHISKAPYSYERCPHKYSYINLARMYLQTYGDICGLTSFICKEIYADHMRAECVYQYVCGHLSYEYINVGTAYI